MNEPPLTRALDDALRGALPGLAGSRIKWRAPLASKHYEEPKDATFWTAIGRQDLREESASWWPSRGGPQWDAVALGRFDDDRQSAVVLVEAKANVPELERQTMGATSEKSIDQIKAALRGTIKSLGATGSLQTWTDIHYQLGNRLAWTLWLRERGVDAFFAHVLFENDSTHIPTDSDALNRAVHAAHTQLGLPDPVPSWMATVTLPAID